MRSVAMLQEMGITVWQLNEPDRVNAHAQINIPTECDLLLIAPQYPRQDELKLVEKIAHSMDVKSQGIFYLSMQQLKLIQEPQSVDWIWFCGEEVCSSSLLCNKHIHSHSLSALQTNPLFKKQLWQQIKSLKEA